MQLYRSVVLAPLLIPDELNATMLFAIVKPKLRPDQMTLPLEELFPTIVQLRIVGQLLAPPTAPPSFDALFPAIVQLTRVTKE
jgi:hypothetical protein